MEFFRDQRMAGNIGLNYRMQFKAGQLTQGFTVHGFTITTKTDDDCTDWVVAFRHRGKAMPEYVCRPIPKD